MASDSGGNILVINAGSSSIKLALFETQDTPKRFVEAVIENIGQPSASFVIKGANASDNSSKSVVAQDHKQAAEILIDWLKQQVSAGTISAIGHRIVHGGPKYYEPTIIDDTMLAALHDLTMLDPDHLPIEIQLVEIFKNLFPDVLQVACFDTAFHHGLPTVSRLLPIPRQYEARGLRRYGFHGLSYAFVLQQIKQLDGPDTTNGRLVIAHLGSGVSLAAVYQGKSIDTTMGLTPTSGVPMSTRSGDLDPGIFLYLAQSEGLDANKINRLVNNQSGLLGISGSTSDMKQLLENEAKDDRAKDAVDLFCYQIKKSIGSLAAALGGLDTLVFTGGMGEAAPKIRARICDGLEFLGIEVDTNRNDANDNLISTDEAQVTVRVIHTDEAWMIAQNVVQLMDRNRKA